MKVYALLSVHCYAYDWSNPSIPKALSELKLQSIFATRLGAEEAQGKLDFQTIITEWEVEP